MKPHLTSKNFTTRSIRTKLSAVLLVLSIIPLLVSTLFFMNYFGGVTRTDNEQIQKSIAELNIARIDEWMQLKASALQELFKTHPEFNSGDPKTLLPLLKLLDESDSQIETYNLMNASGQGVDVNNVPINVADRDYFKRMKESKKTEISNMLVSKKSGKYVLPVGVPILDGSGNLTGLVSATVSPDTLTALTNNIKLGKSGFGYIISGEGDYYTFPDKERIGKKAGDFLKTASAQDALKTIQGNNSGTATYINDDGKEVVSYYGTIPNTSWKLIVTAPTDEVFAAVNKAQNIAVLFVVIVVVLVILISIFLTGFIVKPIISISTVMKKVANGHLEERVEVRTRDEIGEMSRNINAMIDSLAGIVSKINATINQVASASEELLESAEQSSRASAQIASSIQDVASGTDSQLHGAEQSARAMVEMAVGVQRIAESSGIVSDQTGDVSNEVEKGYLEIQSAIEQMNIIGTAADETATVIGELNGHSNEIGQIVHVISDISNQTSLLSLNASIEAARAGEHGRGFAVVANEVKKLAEQTKHSVSSIVGLIQLIQGSTENAVNSMQQNVTEISGGISKMQHIGESFDNIRASIRQVSSQIEEVSATTEQLSAGTEEITASIEDMVNIAKESADNSQSVAGASEEQSAIMAEISTSVQSLNKMMVDLKDLIKVFKV